MTRYELNKVMTNIRINYPKHYNRLKKKSDGSFLSYIIREKLSLQGFDNYEQIKEMCPVGVKIGFFLISLIDK